MKARHKRFLLIGIALVLLGGATALVMNAFQDNLVFFYTPSEVVAGKAPKGRIFRIGGMVVTGSVQRQPDGMTVEFLVTDTDKRLPVIYKGALPDLFKEGKGVVAQGSIGEDGIFSATEVLAKHDENYMPPEAQHAIDSAHAASKTLQIPQK